MHNLNYNTATVVADFEWAIFKHFTAKRGHRCAGVNRGLLKIFLITFKDNFHSFTPIEDNPYFLIILDQLLLFSDKKFPI